MKSGLGVSLRDAVNLNSELKLPGGGPEAAKDCPLVPVIMLAAERDRPSLPVLEGWSNALCSVAGASTWLVMERAGGGTRGVGVMRFH